MYYNYFVMLDWIWYREIENGTHKAKQEIHIKGCMCNFKHLTELSLDIHLIHNTQSCRFIHKYQTHLVQNHNCHLNNIFFVIVYNIVNSVLINQWNIFIGYKIHP